MTDSLDVVRTVADLRAYVAGWRRAGARIGLVPTMGALHEGHLRLVDAARAGCDRVVASLFVNPRQFTEAADLAAYPRDEAGDRAKLAARGADLLYAPASATMYGPGFATRVSVEGQLTADLCARDRPGHFDGVATVVTKLLNQAWADAAYFGEKDFQQLQLIRRLATDLDIRTAIAGVPIVREADGLALSSRNSYLTPEERRRAPRLYAVLRDLAERLADGRPAGRELAAAEARLADDMDQVVYIALRGEDDLAPLDQVTSSSQPARVFAAARLGQARLIDNVPVPPDRDAAP